MAFSIKNFFFFQFFLTAFFYHSVSSVSILIDSDFFIKEVRRRTVWDIGPSNLMGFYNPTKVTNNYFAALDHILPHNNSFPIVVKEGLTMPQIIINWLCDVQSADQIRALVISELKKIETTTGQSTKLSQAIAEHMFTPHRYAKVRECDHEAVKILKRICAQKDHYGNPKHKVFFVTNQNGPTQQELCKNKEIKAVFDMGHGTIISGDAHMLKPDPAFFEYAFKQCGIDDAQLWLYIDIEINFIIAAQKLGKKNLHCIHCKDYNYKFITHELKRLGIIP
jgi:hypothetical protein